MLEVQILSGAPVDALLVKWYNNSFVICSREFDSLTGHQGDTMKLWEATIRDPGPGTEERKVRIGADSAEEARRLLQQLYGPRSVPYLPRQIPQ
jgi:hypothetical protein